MTVAKAIESYVAYLKAERKDGRNAECRLAIHVTPLIGTKLVSELTREQLENVKRSMVKTGDAETERKSKDSANRVFGMLRAALNRCFRDGLVSSDVAWRRVQPFGGVARPRDVFLDPAQVTRLLNTSTGQFRRFIVAALATGARAPGELLGLTVADFDATLGQLQITSGKTGPRSVTLTEETISFFTEITAGRHADALLLPDENGQRWRRNYLYRLMREAAERAKLPAKSTLYCLRHSHASGAILAGMPLLLLASNMGTSTNLLEKTYVKFAIASRRAIVEDRGYKLGVATSGKGKVKNLS